ncbi:unnamed protein product [Ambrosiozyma monospora]|uniref:Unnamed protein product n=1 Tax=Ambrosiozyma monospora TaxID=43982 RepID=A0ACB5SRH6_AMBMO|nr:unnamed protein product [Ambrosiozyma monospora]
MIPFTRANSSTVSTVVLDDFIEGYEIVLDGFPSLRVLEIKYEDFNKFPNLPDSLRELRINYVNVKDLTMSGMDHGVILPTRLSSLMLCGNMSCFMLPKILNIDKLLTLKSVSIVFYPFRYLSEKDPIRNNLPRVSSICINRLQQFVSQLPFDLEILRITIEGFATTKLDHSSAGCPDKLSFKHFRNLKCFELRCLNSDHPFNVSVFPGTVEHIHFFLISPILTGCFSQGIRSIDVELISYRESVSYFLRHFISKLNSLLCLYILIDSDTSADIRQITFPHHLFSFIIEFQCYNHDIKHKSDVLFWIPFLFS